MEKWNVPSPPSNWAGWGGWQSQLLLIVMQINAKFQSGSNLGPRWAVEIKDSGSRLNYTQHVVDPLSKAPCFTPTITLGNSSQLNQCKCGTLHIHPATTCVASSSLRDQTLGNKLLFRVRVRLYLKSYCLAWLLCPDQRRKNFSRAWELKRTTPHVTLLSSNWRINLLLRT
jgi:hypothetical protein